MGYRVRLGGVGWAVWAERCGLGGVVLTQQLQQRHDAAVDIRATRLQRCQIHPGEDDTLRGRCTSAACCAACFATAATHPCSGR